MKECKVEIIIHYVFDDESLNKFELEKKIQLRINEFLDSGYRLISTNATATKEVILTQLYFER